MQTSTPMQGKKIFEKKIPTVIGMVILVIGLIFGVLYFGEGTGVFSPRATPETTPKMVRVTNVTDSSFTISFFTDEPVSGYVLYGQSSSAVRRNRANDDRLQLSGDANEKHRLSHITVRGLEANTSYFYLIGTNGASFDNSGQPFTITTGNRSGTPSAAKTIHGGLATENNTPAEGAIVYAVIENIGPMSSLVRSSGSWAIPLANARIADGSGYASVNDNAIVSLTIQGTNRDQQLALALRVGQAQPAPELVFGQTPDSSPSTPTIPVQEEEVDVSRSVDEFEEVEEKIAEIDSSPGGGGLSGLLDEDLNDGLAKSVINIDDEEHQVVHTTQPVVTGTAAPEVEVTITVNSETQIVQTLTSDAEGNFQIDLASLGSNLEPGEHTASYTYVDPATGEEVTRTTTFTVSDPTMQLAQAEPFSTSSPVPMPSPSPITTAESTTTSPSPSPTNEIETKGEIATRSAIPATDSAMPKSGSVGTTLALIFGGLFFIISGVWSYWIASQLNHNKND